MTENNGDSFSASRAEVFEALGHPTRIRILQELAAKPLTYSELKRAAGMESNGLLTFHLGKMKDLVRVDNEGNYAPTDEGREALRMIEASRTTSLERATSHRVLHLPSQKALMAALLVVLMVFASVSVYQQEQILTLNHQLDSTTAVIGGTRYWYETVAAPLYLDNGSSVSFHGVTFTAVTPSFINSYSNPSQYTFYGSVRLSNGTLLDLTGKTVVIGFSGGNAPMATQGNGTVNYTTVPQFGVAVSFPGGNREVWDGFAVTAVNIPGDVNIAHPYVLLNVTFAQVVLNPWFTDHTDPQAGVLWNTTSGHLTFYVSLT
jgi:DNA-binding transcriptional ArsR family regulator